MRRYPGDDAALPNFIGSKPCIDVAGCVEIFLNFQEMMKWGCPSKASSRGTVGGWDELFERGGCKTKTCLDFECAPGGHADGI